MYFVRYEKIKEIIKMCRGQSAALGRRIHALGQSPFFKKYERKNLEFFT